MAEENSTGSNFIWAIAMIVIVGLLAATLFYSGVLSPTKKHDVDVDISVPSSGR